jgi:light-regulated signal transduction histidine kinase (bacteriophytochrome)
MQAIEEQLKRRKDSVADFDRRIERAEAGVASALVQVVDAVMQQLEMIQQLSDVVREAPNEIRDREAPEVITLYRKWVEESAHLLLDISECERAGFPIARADEFRFAHMETKAFAHEPQRLINSARKADAGKVRPLDEVMNELRRRA